MQASDTFPAAYSPMEDRETDDQLPDTRASDAATLSNSNFVRLCGCCFTLQSTGRASGKEA
jgi:hypothetical protein